MFTCFTFLLVYFFFTVYFVFDFTFLRFMGPDILLFYLFTVLLFHFAWFLLLCICSLLLPNRQSSCVQGVCSSFYRNMHLVQVQCMFLELCAHCIHGKTCIVEGFLQFVMQNFPVCSPPAPTKPRVFFWGGYHIYIYICSPPPCMTYLLAKKSRISSIICPSLHRYWWGTALGFHCTREQNTKLIIFNAY